MKKITLTFICCVALVLCTKMDAQPVAVGGCTAITATDTTFYLQGLYSGCAVVGQTECTLTVSSCSNMSMKAEYRLEELLGGTWTTATSWQQSLSFPGLSHGTYRIEAQYPELDSNVVCEGFARKIYDMAARYIGNLGRWDLPYVYSNRVLIGKTTGADNVYTFIDEPETGPEIAYDFGELVKINTSASQNYDLWWVAIFEDPNYDGHSRYQTNGWTLGTTDEVNLTTVWQQNDPNWNFDTQHGYKVQFVVENNACKNSTYWNVNNRDFFICPAGWGCRQVPGADEEATFAPNYVEVLGIGLEAGHSYRLRVADLFGRHVRDIAMTSARADLSGLANGMYVVNLWKDGKPLATSKLAISN